MNDLCGTASSVDDFVDNNLPELARIVKTYWVDKEQLGTQLHAWIHKSLGTAENISNETTESMETDPSDLIPRFSLPQNCSIIGGKYKVERRVKDNLIIATDDLSRRVAIKMLPLERSLSSTEAKALATISENTPNVVRLYHCFTEGDCFHMVMEYVGEHTLNDFIPVRPTGNPANPKQITEIVEYLCQVLKGLEFLHASGWYHCDIKPSNIGLYEKLVPKKAVLLDFGLAYQEENAAAHKYGKYADFRGGTEGFKSPERKRSPLADIFAFGKTMERLFPNCEQDNQLGHSLREIINRAIEIDPSKRYQSARTLREDLSRLHVWEAKWNSPEWLKLPNYYEKKTKGFSPQNIKSYWYNTSQDLNYDVPTLYQPLYHSMEPQVSNWMTTSNKWNGIVFGLRKCVISRTIENEDQQLALYFAKSDYKHLCVMHELLTKAIPQESELRNLFGTFHEDISPFNVSLGVHVTVITNDEEPKVLFTQRSAHVKEFENYKISCGITETVQEKDQPSPDQPPNIYNTVRRGLEEELGVKLSDEDCDKIKLLGVGAREKDNIWGFVGLVDMRASRNAAYNWENIKLSMLHAQDSNFEIASLHPIPLTIPSVLNYIKQNAELMDEGATALAICILYYCFSENIVNDAIMEMKQY